MITETDRKHAEHSAGFFSQLGLGLVLGAILQLLLADLSKPTATGFLLMTGLLFYGASHIIVEVAYGEKRGRQ